MPSETKQLKTLVRNVIEPGKNLGHSEYGHQKPKAKTNAVKEAKDIDRETHREKENVDCEDCN